MKTVRIFVIALILAPVAVLAQYNPHMDGSSDSETRGDEYFEQMAYGRALDSYEKALEKSPRDKGLQLKIAKCYTELNNQEEVSYYAAQSVSHNSSTPDDVLSYAESLSATENYDKADKMYSRYGNLNSADGRTERKKEGLDNIKAYYEDSAAYMVRMASFNSEQADFSAAFMGDDVVFVSNRGEAKFFQTVNQRDDSFFLDLYRVSGDDAGKLEELNNNLHEGPLSFYDDGTKVIMTTNQPEAKKNKEIDDAVKLKLVIYENGDEGWAVSSEFPHNSTSYSVGHPSFDEGSSTLYFASNMPGGKGGVDIYKSVYSGDSWGTPENMESINTEGDEVFPFAQNGALYFSSNGRGGLGGLDIYKSMIDGGKIITLGYPVNSPKDDFGIVLDGGRSGYLSSNRGGGVGDDDIYEVTIYTLRLEAKVIDLKTGKPIGGNLTIIDTQTGEEVPYTMEDDKAIFQGMRGRTYSITSDNDAYEDNTAEFTADTKDEVMQVSVPMERTKAPVVIEGEDASFIRVENLSSPRYYKLGTEALESVEEDAVDMDGVVVIEDVYFKFNSDEISKGVKEIDKVVAILKSYKDVDIEITAYCDVRGSKKYNEKLAEKRAQRVEDYMTSNGVDADRIRSINIGKSQLYNDCKKCNEEQHQQNRRVEFILNVD